MDGLAVGKLTVLRLTRRRFAPLSLGHAREAGPDPRLGSRRAGGVSVPIIHVNNAPPELRLGSRERRGPELRHARGKQRGPECHSRKRQAARGELAYVSREVPCLTK